MDPGQSAMSPKVDTDSGKCINPLPNDKIIHLSKFWAFADDKINVTEILKFVSVRVENIVKKEENAG